MYRGQFFQVNSRLTNIEELQVVFYQVVSASASILPLVDLIPSSLQSVSLFQSPK